MRIANRNNANSNHHNGQNLTMDHHTIARNNVNNSNHLNGNVDCCQESLNDIDSEHGVKFGHCWSLPCGDGNNNVGSPHSVHSNGSQASSSTGTLASASGLNGVSNGGGAGVNVDQSSNDMAAAAADAEGVWSPDIDQSFQEALAIYPPCGRRKIILSEEGKMYGRNELIARYIKLRTGKTRTRKQVSSHIQVLARKKAREYQAKIKDDSAKEKVQNTLRSMSSAQIVSLGPLPTKVALDAVVSSVAAAAAVNNNNSNNNGKLNITDPSSSPLSPTAAVAATPSLYSNASKANNVVAASSTNGHLASPVANAFYPTAAAAAAAAVARFTSSSGFSATVSPHSSTTAFVPALSNTLTISPADLLDIKSLTGNSSFPPFVNHLAAAAAVAAGSPFLPLSTSNLHAPRPSTSSASSSFVLPPPWEGRSICTSKIRLCEFSAYCLITPTRKHDIVYISDDVTYDDPMLEEIDISQIHEKFSSGPQGLRELYRRGPQNAFFLVKFWADISFNIIDEQNTVFAVDSRYESTDNMTIAVSTKACSFGSMVVEKVEHEYARFENGRFIYRIQRSPLCEYMNNFILRLKTLPQRQLMNSVLEHFTILQLVTCKETQEVLLCIAIVLEVSEGDGSQHRLYKLTYDENNSNNNNIDKVQKVERE